MSRCVVVACLAICLVGGCRSTQQATGDTSMDRPRWVQYDWWDEHPVAERAAYCAMVAGLIAAGSLAAVPLMSVAPVSDKKDPKRAGP
jgi:hypothetical protein